MRRGLTLLELTLVLAILAVAAAFAIPSFEAMILSKELTGGAGRLELEIRKARLEAIRTGQIQAMRISIGNREVNLQPWLSADDSASASAGATVMTQTGQIVSTDSTGAVSGVGTLTGKNWSVGESVTFENAQVFMDARSAVQTGVFDTSAASGLSSPIFFYPDGSTSTARVVLTNTRGRRMAVELRGVTGSTQVVELVPNTGVATP